MNIIAKYNFALAGALSLIVVGTTLAQPGPEPEKCLSLNSIKSTEIIDERHIVFHMRNGDTYYNQLPHRCGGLRRDDTIMYRPTMNRLCDLDFITVLNSGGFGFIQGPSCGLGKFHPTDEAGVALLKEQAEAQRQLRNKKKESE